MWSEFYLSVACTGLSLLIPGYLAMRAIGANRTMAVCCSPVVSLSLIAALGQLYALVGIPGSPVAVLAPLVILTALGLALSKVRKFPELTLPSVSPLGMCLALLLGAALGYNLYISRLGTPDAVFQAYDVTWHLDLIQAMSESGKLTSLGASPYLTAPDAAIAPANYSMFYPAAWHVLCALVKSLAGVSTTIAINASMFVLPCLAFPLGIVAFIAALFPESKKHQIVAGVLSLAFVAFPWNLMAFGPVYANVAGFALLPAVWALFVHLLSDEASVSDRARTIAAILVCCIGLVLCHPNTIFTCIVMLAPFCVSRIAEVAKNRGVATVPRLAVCIAFALLCLGFWTLCYKLPLFRDTVSHVWPPFSRLFQQVVSILTLSYSFGFNVEIAAQLVLATFVIMGAIRLSHTGGKRWIVASYALFCLILIVSATQRSELKQFLAGFWYPDPMRLASIAAMAALPLAVEGFAWVLDIACEAGAFLAKRESRQPRPALMTAVITAVLLVVNFMPEFSLPGIHHEYTAQEVQQSSDKEWRDWPKSVHTTFGDYRDISSEVYSYQAPLDMTEKVFLRKCTAMVEEGALVVNDPMDGSFLGYGMDGLRMYYRNFTHLGTESETEESRIIRTRLTDYTTDAEVQAAVDAVDAKYVIQLRHTGDDASFITLRGDYRPDLTSGINSITDETSGFTCVYRVGPMALYRINR